MNKYRFKTEEEFIKEFGENWKNDISKCWNNEGSMDYLFGKNITPMEMGSDGLPNTSIDTWGISSDMYICIGKSKITQNGLLPLK